MKLVIVESPTKAKTISRFLGNNFKIISSFGHVRDLPKSKLGVDVENDFTPTYIIPTKARKTVSSLKKLAKDANEIILATDEDREGEAIAWHIAEALGLGNSKLFKRIVFHEITKEALFEALKNPRELNTNLINAQQARRVLDRLVGYSLSPLLWKKVMGGLSAGRVQSVAVRLVVDREKEINAFRPEDYWTIEAMLKKAGSQEFLAKLWKVDDKPVKDLSLREKKEVDDILLKLKNTGWQVDKIEKKEVRRYPLPPFITSTLQQASGQRLGFSAKQTMMLAQQLYEGVKLAKGQEGLITYMRTDSTSLSGESKQKAKAFIVSNFGPEYSQPKDFKTKSKLAQEAHEAIRPTNPAYDPEKIKEFLDSRQFRLYQLIWQRFMASQMAPSVSDITSIEISTGTPYFFKASGSVQKFDGFLRVFLHKSIQIELPELSQKDKLDLVKLLPEKHQTQGPPRYSEATLVKALEEFGIGRPSTYAPVMSTIQDRGYVEKNEQKKFKPTEVGIIVNNLLVENFPTVVDVAFTAHMEEDLDKIAEGTKEWVPTIREFYIPFAKTLEKKKDEIKESDIKKGAPTDKICPQCGKNLVLKLGRFGKFYACSGFPDCKHTENFKEKIDMKCPDCVKGDVVVKRTKKRRIFYGCSRYPDCKYASWKNPKKEEEEKTE